MKHDLIVPAGMVGAYYVGRIRERWIGRGDRKTAEAVEHIRKTLRSDKNTKGKNE